MKFVRLVTIVLALNILFSGTVFAKSYSDVPSNYKYLKSISALSDGGVVKGYADGSFKPEKQINRAEAIKILIESQYEDNVINSALLSNHSATIRFPDVKVGQWYDKYVEIAYLNKIIKGYPDGTFRPSDKINFAEALKVILESYNITPRYTSFEENKLLYVNNGDWFKNYFTYASKHNLINQNKFYHPSQLITRGEFAEIIYRLESMLESGLSEYTTSTNPTSNEYTVTIPKLKIINLPVFFADPHNEQSALEILKKGIGHYLAEPGGGKKLVLFGHSSGYSWDNSPYKTILKSIDKLNNGDRIYLNYKEKGYVYEIFKSDIIPQSQDLKIVENPNANELALYTCWPPNSISQRYVVYGKPVL
ncbi:S-layer homology domain-containing protein [Candidatus Peregrinibacteria bacterium]|nr:S-layer homology domain-containing protein [Candidatus Peregrinibacteria bacterium]